MIRVLFVCLGNICRSPMAEAVFREKVHEAGLSHQIEVDSAGTGGWHVGEMAHPGTRQVLQKHGITYQGQARQLTRDDLKQFDYVLAMDASNLSHIQRLLGPDDALRPALFLSYAKAAGTVREAEVPDPYYDDRFEHVYGLVEKGAQALLETVRREHQL